MNSIQLESKGKKRTYAYFFFSFSFLFFSFFFFYGTRSMHGTVRAETRERNTRESRKRKKEERTEHTRVPREPTHTHTRHAAPYTRSKRRDNRGTYFAYRVCIYDFTDNTARVLPIASRKMPMPNKELFNKFVEIHAIETINPLLFLFLFIVPRIRNANNLAYRV